MKKINWTRRNKLFGGLGGLAAALLAIFLVFTFVGMPGGGKLFGLTVNGYNIRHGANLSGASLIGANLIGADLRRADLTFAKLTGADLSKADLDHANLSGANLTGAVFSNTKMPDGSIRKQ